MRGTKGKIEKSFVWFWFIIIFLFLLCAYCERRDSGEKPASHSKGIKNKTKLTPSWKSIHHLPSSVILRDEKNGSILPLSRRFRTESYNYPGLVDLCNRECLEEVVSPGKTEFEKMRLLNDWVNSQWERGFPESYPPWNANVILPLIRSGTSGGFCAQYAVVMVQACLSLGWQARYLDTAHKSQEAHLTHFTVEVWSNQFNKWILLDPFFGCHFEKNGVPLSALELHNFLVNKKTDNVEFVKGDGKNVINNLKDLSKGDVLARYYHIAVDLRNDHMSRPHGFYNRRQNYLSWRDGFTSGRKDVFNYFATGKERFNFPLNQLRLSVKGGEDDTLNVMILTNTPGLESVEIKEGKQWKRYYSPFEAENRNPALDYTFSSLYGGVFIYRWKLTPGKNELRARSINVRQVKGPEFYLRVRKFKSEGRKKTLKKPSPNPEPKEH